MTDQSTAPVGADRLISLGDEQDMLCVRPGDEQGTGMPFPAFQLPAFPLSYEVWLCRLLETMQEHHQRVMAMVLTLDCQRHRWWQPIMPRQQCRADGVSWQLSAAEFEDVPPQMRIGGSVQSGMLADDDEIATRLPPFDGVHLYLGLCQVQRGYRRWFLRTGGEIKAVPQMCVVFDDWRMLLQACHSKLSRSGG